MPDFRFKFDRRKSPPAEIKERQAQETQTVQRTRGLAYGLTIPFIMLSGPLGGWVLGAWLDSLLGTRFVMILLILGGTAASFKMVIDLLGKLSSGPE
jgi:F0F1-type ATP synthase assembly protein I